MRSIESKYLVNFDSSPFQDIVVEEVRNVEHIMRVRLFPHICLRCQMSEEKKGIKLDHHLT